MIVVGLGRGSHDCSISAYIKGEFRYAKAERKLNTKHARAGEEWYYSVLLSWGVKPNDVDLYIETDPGVLSLRVPHNGEPFIMLDSNRIVLDHHLAHAWSDFNYEDGKNAVVVDGKGSAYNTSLLCKGEEIIRASDGSIGHTMRNMYSLMVGNSTVDAAGKIMGLSSYGFLSKKIYEELKEKTPSDWIDYLDRNYSDRSPRNEKWVDAIKTVCELCYENILENRFSFFDKSQQITYSGGCALNIDWNSKLSSLGYDLSIMPYVYDGGLSIGCLRYGLRVMGASMDVPIGFPYLQDDVDGGMATDEIIDMAAEDIAQGKIVGWYQGHGELGPRALGNRSILMRPDLKDGKDTINQKVKHREWYRPFGASVLKEDASQYFSIEDSPYMLYSAKVLVDNLYSVTHVDGTCRHQTVTYESNPTYYKLLDRVKEKTGLSVVLNTSLNAGGKPIAGKPYDAIELLSTTELDTVYVGSNRYEK